MDFYWYDYETTGLWLSEDRIVQFGGVRTDDALRPKGKIEQLYCKPAPDHLPQVRACLVHHISPQEARRQGRTEYEFAARIHKLLSRPNTCAVGYNAMQFDHRLTQHLFYRNLLDPYGWHYENGNTKWDIIDLFRAAYVLRPDGINWPKPQDDRPPFHLEDLAKANGMSTAFAHDTEADVQTTLELARLIKQKQPKLWDYYLSLRKKDVVNGQLRQGTFLYVSGSVLYRRRSGTIAAVLGKDRRGYIYAYDLSYDPGECFAADGPALLDDESIGRKALYRFRANASPFVVSFAIDRNLSPKNHGVLERMDLDLKTLRRHEEALAKLNRGRNLLDRVCDAYEQKKGARAEKDFVDDLYGGGFIGNSDRRKLRQVLTSIDNPASWDQIRFSDPRLPELVFRFRARNFGESLSEMDEQRWRMHCRLRILEQQDQNGLTSFGHFTKDIAEERQKVETEKGRQILDDLEAYAAEVKAWLDQEG